MRGLIILFSHSYRIYAQNLYAEIEDTSTSWPTAWSIDVSPMSSTYSAARKTTTSVSTLDSSAKNSTDTSQTASINATSTSTTTTVTHTAGTIRQQENNDNVSYNGNYNPIYYENYYEQNNDSNNVGTYFHINNSANNDSNNENHNENYTENYKENNFENNNDDPNPIESYNPNNDTNNNDIESQNYNDSFIENDNANYNETDYENDNENYFDSDYENYNEHLPYNTTNTTTTAITFSPTTIFNVKTSVEYGKCNSFESTEICILPANSVEEALAQQIGATTVRDVKLGLAELNLDGSNLQNFAKVSQTELEKLLGDPMVDSVNAFFVNADRCETKANQLNLINFFTIQGSAPFTVQVAGIPNAFQNEIFTEVDQTGQISLYLTNMARFDDPEYREISSFVIHASSSTGTSGIIPVTVTESTSCAQFRKDKSAPVDYDQELKQFSFVVNPSDLKNWHTEFRQQLTLKLSSVFNSIGLVERIQFVQFRPVHEVKHTPKWKRIGLHQTGCLTSSGCQSADIQLIISKSTEISQMEHSQTLNQSLYKALEITQKYMMESSGELTLQRCISQ